jgi:hypothetical protein
MSIAGPVLVFGRAGRRRRTVRRDVAFMRVRPPSVLCPGRRGARHGKDETSNESFHVRSPFSAVACVSRPRTAIERHHETEHVECQIVVPNDASQDARDLATGAASVALLRRASQIVSAHARLTPRR